MDPRLSVFFVADVPKVYVEIRHVHMFSVSLMEHSPLGAVHIFFDTSTYDEIERDVKVVNGFPTKKDLKHRNNFLVFTSSLDILLKLKHDKGDNGSPIGPDWRHNGPSHWLLHPQRG